jgi:glucosamine--fructose-6-phosphate aminotransferase (isomerizing)
VTPVEEVTMADETQLERAIRSQPEHLERLVRSGDLHSQVEALRQCHRIWLVGTGTSFHAAELGAMMLQDAGRAATAVASINFVNHAPPVGNEDAVILISHNAGEETAYAASAYALAAEAGLRVIALTRQGSGLPHSLETVPKEQSHTYSVSYTGALVLLARLASGVGAEHLTQEAIEAVPGAVREAIERPGIDDVPTSSRVLVMFGEGPAAITAREGALKVREASRFLAEGYDVEYLLHGSAVPLAPSDHLLALTSPDTDGLVEAVARAAEGEGIAVTRLGETADGLPPVLAQIPLTARLQLLALRFALEREQDPDLVITGAWAADALWAIGGPRSR